jgi:hypothetical protein
VEPTGSIPPLSAATPAELPCVLTTRFTVPSTGRAVACGGKILGKYVRHVDLLKETHDECPIIPWTCFSIELALCLPNLGVRTETNLFVEERGARVTGEIHTGFVRL